MFNLPELRYDYSALEPFFDADTMKIHHTKHHQTYVDNLNAAWFELEKIAPSFSKMPLEEILKFENLEKLRDLLMSSKNDSALAKKLQNHGGGHLNHALFWRILKPAVEGENLPSKEFLRVLEKQFFSFENFKATFSQAAISHFGSGWAWLRLAENGDLEIETTSNQDRYNFDNSTPILGLDLWEHAYYLKYQNRRADYVEAFWSVVNWAEVERNYFEALETLNGISKTDFEEGKCDLAGCDYSENFENFTEATEVFSEKRVLYTDGSASPNPGPGGFAVIENGAPIFLGGEENSTNIRMEGLALKSALEILSGTEAEVWTDSEFWINVLTKWAPAWQKSGWKKKSGEIKNLDIVKPLFEIFQNSKAEIKWLKGHAGHEFNEMADEWANRAREGERV